MFKPLLIATILFSATHAIDFSEMKEKIWTYIDGLDHPNRDENNIFSKNLAVSGSAVHTCITIYTDGLSMISEEKNVTIPQPGNVQIMYADVSSKVDLSSVSMSFDKEVKLYSQRYAYDVVNLNSLLHKYISKYILYINDQQDNKPKRATLLAMDPIIIRDLKSGNIFTPFKVFFENIPEDMAVTPTLFWNVHTQAKALQIKLEYLSAGISWSSDYNLYLKNNGTLDFNSWVTIKNNSGTSYTDANITIVTGRQNRVTVEDKNSTNVPQKMSANVIEKGENEYALYAIPHTENLNNKEEKQIAFLQVKDVVYKEYLQHEALHDFNDRNNTTINFSKIIAFDNIKSNHLGTALPEGVVRLYRYDTLSNKRFIASVKLPNIKADQTVELSIDDTNDIIGEEKMTKTKVSASKESIHYSIELKNISKEEKVIKLKRMIPEQVGKITIKDNCKEVCQKEILSPSTTLYTIILKPSKIYLFTIDYLRTTQVSKKDLL